MRHLPVSPFLDAFRPALLNEGLYYTDGQVQDVVYVWGSLLQSKMYQAGVTCSDCHDPHTADLKVPGDGVCAQCHSAERYATKTHHFHPEDSTGASCIECHMPATTYMRVDARHDHSFRIPRPDQSIAIGTPNACNRCHVDKSAQWAAEQVSTWYGRAPAGLQRYAPALHAARNGLPAAGRLLQQITADANQPAIARATALQALGAYPDADMLELVQQGLAADDPLQRLGALDALQSLGPGQKLLAASLLWDDLKAVRIEAARLLAVIPEGQLPEAVRAQRARGIQEYIAVQAINAERPEAQLNLGNLFAELARDQEAEQAYGKALTLQPRFVPASINLAQLMSQRDREQEAEGVLRRGLRLEPESADLHHALGLSHVRQKRLDESVISLSKAAELAPENARYGYVQAVALQSSGRISEAIAVLEQVHQRHPGDIETLSALILYHREVGALGSALDYARKMQELSPNDPSVEQLIRALKAADT